MPHLLCVLLMFLALAALPAQAAEPKVERCPLAQRPLPQSLTEAVDLIVKELDSKSRATLLQTKREDLIQFHHGWGTGIRNSMCLWGGNDQLIRSACGGKLCHPDDASMLIMEAVWDRLHAAKH
jgi:hypothetical protein